VDFLSLSDENFYGSMVSLMLPLLRATFAEAFQVTHPRSVTNGTLAHVESWRRSLEQAEVITLNRYTLEHLDDISSAEFD
jgi:hypothetical protein